jgi:glycerophosphoryl diester phosphodiesterase
MKDRIVAHRGNAVEFRENSIEAIRSAIELGVRYVEFDVQMSKDGVPCLLHDAYLSRLFGKDREAVDTSFEALQQLGVASLSEIIDLIRKTDVTAFVEIKRDCFAVHGREHVVHTVCQLISTNCVVICFDHEAALTARDNGFRIGFVIGDMSGASKDLVDMFAPDYVFCDQRHIHQPVWSGPIWCSYEISDAATAQRVTHNGVQLLETMSVRRMLQ